MSSSGITTPSVVVVVKFEEQGQAADKEQEAVP